MQKWEYDARVVNIRTAREGSAANPRTILEMVKAMGEEGWELILHTPGLTPEFIVLYFKRPKP